MSENQKGEGSEHSGEAGDAVAGLADDRLYRGIAARPRRRLLYYLLEAREATVEELAEVLVGWDASEQGGMATTEDFEHAVVALRHSHLPALADVNLVRYDPSAGTVKLGSVTDGVATLLEKSVAARTR